MERHTFALLALELDTHDKVEILGVQDLDEADVFGLQVAVATKLSIRVLTGAHRGHPILTGVPDENSSA